ncbi:E3 ubiquitin-protein ligase rififylin isoform X4 [Psammomys obesus]|uniref:E3 ubiquitin-protein ligase rififylin isoform X4 n=1 Tax=Psammomys obesus TaxID=48139 RepID=UPI0024531C9F|nr:E3 ubiquitin-protein ligase rififylin isoform X4 [Psammomys obesus]
MVFKRCPDFIMWASCCNWLCLDGQPEEAPPPQGARTQAYSNPGYSSFPSPTGPEPSCKACGIHFASTTGKATGHVSQDHEEPIFLESTATVPPEDETQSIDSEDSFVPGRRASLSDLTHLEDIEGLTVRQLKEILARNFVNYKGCCEKWELMERVTRLYKDQKGLQHLVSADEDQNGGAVPSGLEENLCKICMDSPIDCVLLECGHMVTCTKCGKRMNECPICRQYVIRAVHVFRS